MRTAGSALNDGDGSHHPLCEEGVGIGPDCFRGGGLWGRFGLNFRAFLHDAQEPSESPLQSAGGPHQGSRAHHKPNPGIQRTRCARR